MMCHFNLSLKSISNYTRQTKLKNISECYIRTARKEHFHSIITKKQHYGQKFAPDVTQPYSKRLSIEEHFCMFF